MSTEKEKIFESFGDVLNSIMQKRGKNQSWLAEKTGKDKKQISDYVNNNTTPFNDTIQEIASRLGVGIEKRKGKFILFDSYESDHLTVEEMITEYKEESVTLTLPQWLINHCFYSKGITLVKNRSSVQIRSSAPFKRHIRTF